MHWVIQDSLFNEAGFKLLIDALDKLGCSYSIHKVVPFSLQMIPDADFDGRVVIMGSNTLNRIAKSKGWEPGAWTDNLDFQIQREHWGTELLNHDAIVSRLADVDLDAFEGRMFVRPVDDSKSFAGTTMDREEMREMIGRVTGVDYWTSITPDTVVMVAQLKTIYREIRTWVVHGEIVTASGYKRGRDVVSYVPDDDELEYAQRIVDMWSPNEAYCLDVASTTDGMRVIEVNNINSSGFYGADMQKLVHAIERRFGV